MLRPDTIRRTNMVTEAFSGAQAPITHVGDHVSGLFPNCHVVPQSTFNLVAVGPYLDNRPDSAVILSATMALEIANIDFKAVQEAPNPRANLVAQLQMTNADGSYRATITRVGTRPGPGHLYHTNLFNPPAIPEVRSKLVNSACTKVPWDKLHLPLPNNYRGGFIPAPKPLKPPTSRTIKATAAPPLKQKPIANTPDHEKAWISSTTTEKALIELRHIHCALGHPSEEVLNRALSQSDSTRHHQLRRYVKLMDPCNVCPMGSQRAEPHPEVATTRATAYFSRLFLDCSGKQPVASIGGFWFFLLITDDATRMKWVRLLKSVSQVAAVFDDFLRTVVRQGMAGARGCVSLVRTDNGPDFNCDDFRQVLRRNSITHEPSPPDASQQRGVAERGIGVLSAMARAALVWSKAPLPFWGECMVNHTTPTSNNRPHSANPGKATPYHMANPKRPSQLSKLRPFGCLAFNLVKVMDRGGKLNPASSCGFFAGYGLTPDGTINGYRVMNLRTNRFTTKCNVRFNVQLPALRYALSALVHSPQQMLVGRTIRKRFEQGTFEGKITAFSTVDNITLYDITYSDGDKEQLDMLEVLQHIAPIQEDMEIKKPKMHKRLRQSTKHDRARLGRDLLPDTVAPVAPIAAPVTNDVDHDPDNTTAEPHSTVFLRRSSRKKKPPDRLTSAKSGTNSNSQPLHLPTHTTNKANAARLCGRVRLTKAESAWRAKHNGRFAIILMTTILTNVVSVNSARVPSPNAVINGINVHCYDTTTPPLPKGPSRDVPLPSSYNDAVYGPYHMFWRPAIQLEINSLFKYGVWRLEPLPPNALVLPCKFVFRVKPDGNDPPGISKFKTRYCGKGFHQRKGIHFISSYAPVASATSSRMIVAFATEMGWPLHGMDVRNAYLNAPLESEIVLFVRPPPTVHVPKGFGLRLMKGLYGTMQGGNRWAVHKHSRLIKLGYDRNVAEPSLYHRQDSHGIVLMTVIVDDFQITGWPPQAVSRAKHELNQTWDMTDLGPLRYFASVEVCRDTAARTTTLKQTGYVEDVLSRYGLSDTYGKPTPCTTSIYSQRLLEPVSSYPPMFNNDYRSQVGSLGYFRRTRPDLCVALGISAQFSKLGLHGPQHYRALRNIMRYLKATMHYGLLYTSTRKSFRDPWDLAGHVDSDWASWKGSRRSRTGYLIFLNANLIAFGSKLQSAVATSSAEAEYMALSYITKLLLWILHMIESIPSQFVRRPICVREDNKPCINLANNHAASKFTRHIGICHHFLRDHYESGSKQFKLMWVPSPKQKANGMTKPLPRAEYVSFRDSVVSDLQC